MTETAEKARACPEDGTGMAPMGRRAGGWRCPKCKGVFLDVRRHPRRDAFRRGASGAVVVALAAIAVASYVPASGIAVCRDTVAGNATVRVCQPIGPSDVVAAGLVLLVAVMLLWPDLAEFSVAGLLSIRKDVDEARRVADEGAVTANRVSDEMQYVTLSQPAPDLASAAKGAEKKQQAFTIDAAIAVPPRLISDERAQIESELLALSDDLDTYVRLLSAPLDQYRKAQHDGLLPPAIVNVQMAALRRWQAQFADQLRAWAIVRNAVVHLPGRLSDDDVRSAVELGRVLLQTARTAVKGGGLG